MSDVELRFRRGQPGDGEAINQAFNQVFGLDRSIEEWHWKFCRADVASPIVLAESGRGELLAHYAGIPAKFQVDGEVFQAGQIVDVYSTKRARRLFARRGVYVQTVEAFFEEFGKSGLFPLLYGFPGKRALRLGLLQLGYDAMEPQPVWVWERRTSRGMFSVRRYSYRAEEVAATDPRFDALWDRVRGRYRAAVVRDGARVRQRLAGHPSIRYRLFMVAPRLSREPVAWVAFRVDEMVRWLDLVWDADHPGALELVAHLGRVLARQEGRAGESLWLVGDPRAEGILGRLGYQRQAEPNGLVMVARAFPGGPEVTRLENRVYVTLADSDLA